VEGSKSVRKKCKVFFFEIPKISPEKRRVKKCNEKM